MAKTGESGSLTNTGTGCSLAETGKAGVLAHLRRLLAQMPPPASLFSGLHIRSSLAPDNIVFFRRTHTADFLPQGVSNNYHHRFELFIVLENGGKVRVGENTHVMGESECFLVFPNQFHAYMDVEHPSIDWLFITFNLHQADLIEALRDSPRKLTAAAAALLEPLLETYLKPGKEGADGLQAAYLLSRFLLKMLEAPPAGPSASEPGMEENTRAQILEHINRYVRDNLGTALSIGDLAAALGYSVSYLRSVFREQLGVSLGRYIRESRLSEAAQLLQDPKLKVTDVAQRCGFESLYVFSRAFKKAYGIPPKDYSKMLQRLPVLPQSSTDAAAEADQE